LGGDLGPPMWIPWLVSYLPKNKMRPHWGEGGKRGGLKEFDLKAFLKI